VDRRGEEKEIGYGQRGGRRNYLLYQMEQFGNVSESRRLLPRHSSTSGTVTVAMGMHAEPPM
jgi:hypothetical protein